VGDWLLIAFTVAPTALVCFGGWIAYNYPQLWFWLM
jgi:hypothetical protein